MDFINQSLLNWFDVKYIIIGMKFILLLVYVWEVLSLRK